MNIKHCYVFRFVASQIGFKNIQTSVSKEPKTNLTGLFPGPLNPDMWLPFTAPSKNVSRFGGHTFTKPGLDWSITTASVGKPLNLTYNVSPVLMGLHCHD